jgi:pantothenate synthetase
VSKALERGRAVIEEMSVPVTIDYFAVANARTLNPVDAPDEDALALAAIRLPSARLIDSLVLAAPSPRASSTNRSHHVLKS